MQVKNLGIIGLGMIGGSVAQAVKKYNSKIQIQAFARNKNKANEALDLDLIDSYSLDLEDFIKVNDFIFLAIPVLESKIILKQIAKILATLKQDKILIDAGSTKASIVATYENLSVTERKYLHFIPSHPIAGKEKIGFKASAPDLFVKHKVIITPIDKESKYLESVKEFWLNLGADVVVMDAKQHDIILGATSHLPHLLSFMLVSSLAKIQKSKGESLKNLFSFGAGGFADFTRTASSDKAMWSQISLDNKENITFYLKSYIEDLTNLKTLIEKEDKAAIELIMENAKNVRENQVLKR